jgi:hypothetical protein
MELAERKIYCELLAQLLIVDGVFASTERTFLNEAMDRLGLTREDRYEVFGNVNIDGPVEDKLRRLSRETRVRLTEELERAAEIDSGASAKEDMLLAKIRAVMSRQVGAE